MPFADAAAEAVEANLHIRNLRQKARLVDRITGAAERSVEALVNAHDAKLVKRVEKGELAAVTLKSLRSAGRATKKEWGKRPVHTVETRDVSTFLNRWKEKGQDRMAALVRSYLIDLFRFSEAEGWIPRGSNPVTITEKITAQVKRARLSLEEFQTIYDAAAPLERWIRRSMELAIVTAQRREDLAIAEFKRRHDSTVFVEDRMLWVTQQKVKKRTGMRLRIPFELELKALGWSLEEVVARCRDDIVSRWLIHHVANHTNSLPGDAVFVDTITKGFRRARDRTGLKWPDGLEPPTFHEIRSLAARLYEKQGNVDVQALLGHTDPATTRLYTDSRGTEWADIKVA